MLELYYVKGDVSPSERLRLIDTSTGMPYDFTGAAVSVEVRRLGETTTFATLAAETTDAVNGRVRLVWSPAVLAQAGKLRGDFVVAAPSSTFTLRDAVSITVRDRP